MATLTPLSEAEKQLHVAGSFVTSIDNDHLINQHFLHDNSGIKLFQTTANAITNVTNSIFIIVGHNFVLLLTKLFSYICISSKYQLVAIYLTFYVPFLLKQMINKNK